MAKCSVRGNYLTHQFLQSYFTVDVTVEHPVKNVSTIAKMPTLNRQIIQICVTQLSTSGKNRSVLDTEQYKEYNKRFFSQPFKLMLGIEDSLENDIDYLITMYARSEDQQ